MKVGITGGAGFLGSQVARELVTENEVFILDTEFPKFVKSHSNYQFIACDVTDKAGCIAALLGPDVVFRRAGLMGNVPSMHAPEVAEIIVELIGSTRQWELRSGMGAQRQNYMLIEKAKWELGWLPQYDLRRGLQEFIIEYV